MSSRSDPARLLRYSLLANAAFSFTSGMSFALAAPALASALGVPDAAQLRGLGVNLVVFAALLAWLGSRASIRPALALAVIWADLAWVAATPVVLWSGVLSTTGSWTAVAIADVVLVLAILQYLGLRRARTPAALAAGGAG